MPAGLIIYGDGGQMQIDGSTPMVTLRRSGVVATSAVSGVPSMYTGALAVSGDEFVAFRPQGFNWGTMWGNGNGQALFASTGGPATFDYWVFGPHQDSGANYGLRVWNESGGLIYDTGRPMCNILGPHDGTGGPTFWGNSNVAVVPKNIHCFFEIGVPPNYVAPWQRQTMGGVQISGNQITTSNRVMAANGPTESPIGKTTPDSSWTNNQDNSFMVVGLDNLF